MFTNLMCGIIDTLWPNQYETKKETEMNSQVQDLINTLKHYQHNHQALATKYAADYMKDHEEGYKHLYDIEMRLVNEYNIIIKLVENMLRNKVVTHGAWPN